MNDDELNAIEARVSADVRRLRTECETAVATAARLRAERDAFRRGRDTVERESEQEIARLRAELDATRKERNDLRAENIRNLVNGGKVIDALQAKALELQAIIEGRTTAPTDTELAAHDAAGGSWLVTDSTEVGVVDDTGALSWRGAEGLRWWALDATGRPTAWPVVTPVAEST